MTEQQEQEVEIWKAEQALLARKLPDGNYECIMDDAGVCTAFRVSGRSWGYADIVRHLNNTPSVLIPEGSVRLSVVYSIRKGKIVGVYKKL